MTVYLDMDGTFVDFYGVKNWLEYLLAEDVFPYKAAAPMWDMTELLEVLNAVKAAGLRVGVISWCSKNGSKEYNADVRRTKKEWLKTQLPGFVFDEIHIVKYGTPKWKVANDDGFLFDDEEHNRIEWAKHRGRAFNPAELFTEFLS